MRYFFLALIIGFCLSALLLTVFFTAGKKNKKQKQADLELVKNSGDDSLIRLFEQADSDNERDGIVEFIKEKLGQEQQGLTNTSLDLAPAGTPQADAGALPAYPEALPLEAPPQAEQPQEASRRAVPGISGAFTGAADAAEPIPEHTIYGQPGVTHMLALEDIDWNAIEDEMQKRREEEARIMAQNQQIQEVFSKIKNIEERLMTEQQDD